MRPCLKSRTNSSTGSTSNSSQGLSFSTLSSCTPSTSAQCQGTTDACRIRKCVAFEADACLETVFTADEWDRTPTEPARKLSYQDLLELKEIQRSLPRANQPPDHLAGRAARQYLSTVPISLLPLLPSTTPATPPSSYATSPDPSPSGSPAPTAWNPHSARSDMTVQLPPRSNWTPIQSPTSPNMPSSPSADPSGETRWVSFNPDSPRDPGSLASTSPPARSNLHAPRPSLPQQTGKGYSFSSSPGPPQSYPPPPSNAPAQKQKPRFAFLPLLDSQDSSDASSPTSPSMSPNSSRTVPYSHASSPGQATTSPTSSKAYSDADVDPPFFQLPPPKRGRQGSVSSNPSGATSGSRFSAYYNREGGDWDGDRQHRSFGSAMSGARSRSKSPSSATNFGRSHPAFQAMYPAGTTLSPSSSRAGSRHPSPVRPAVPAPSPVKEKKKNVMVINGIEIDLDDGEDEDEIPPPPPPAPAKKKNVMVINGIEIDLDDDDDEPAPPTPLKVAQPQPTSPIAQPRPLSPAVSLPGSRSSSSSSSPKSGHVGSSTSNGLPTPPPSTSPSPVPSWRSLPMEEEPEKESPFVGLHAPVTFKRGPPRPAVALTTVPASPPKVSSPTKSPARSRAGSVSSNGSGSPTRTRRGSVCGQQSGRMFDPRASPRLVPRT